MGELLTEHNGGGGVDGEGSGGQSPSRQGAGTGPSDPRNGVSWRRSTEMYSGVSSIVLGFTPWGLFMVQRAASEGPRGSHTWPRRGSGFSCPSRLVGPAQAAYELGWR